MKYGRFSKRAYEILRTLTKTAHRQSSIIEDKQGKPLAEEQSIVNRCLTQSLVIPIPKKCNLRKCENYRTLSLISHSSKMLLRIILSRLNPQVERILSDEQLMTIDATFSKRIDGCFYKG